MAPVPLTAGRFARFFALLTAVALLSGCLAITPEWRDGPLELTEVPHFPQTVAQCGPAALATVLTAAGVAIDPQQLAPETYLPARGGTLQPELLAAMRRHGRMPVQVTPSLDGLVAQLRAGRPVLVLQNLGIAPLPSWHYAVVVGYLPDRKALVLRSGGQARRLTGIRRFYRTWARSRFWGLVALTPGDTPGDLPQSGYRQAAVDLERAGLQGAARAAYRAGVEAYPGDPVLALGLANTQLAAGDVAVAIDTLAAYLERAEPDALIMNNLAYLYELEGCSLAADRLIDGAVQAASSDRMRALVTTTAAEIRQRRTATADTEIIGTPLSASCP